MIGRGEVPSLKYVVYTDSISEVEKKRVETTLKAKLYSIEEIEIMVCDRRNLLHMFNLTCVDGSSPLSSDLLYRVLKADCPLPLRNRRTLP